MKNLTKEWNQFKVKSLSNNNLVLRSVSFFAKGHIVNILGSGASVGSYSA
jgi:hypothetical protein